MRIGIDLDGCVYSFVDALRQYIVMEGRDPSTLPHESCWEFYEVDWGYSLPEFLTICNEAVDNRWVFRMGVPLPGAVEAMHQLKADGHTLHIVTDRSFGTKSVSNTASWLGDWEIPFDSLTFSKDKTCVPTDAFIDDRPKNVDELRAVGCRAFLLDNGRDDQVGHPYLIRSWDEFLRLINYMEEAA